MGGTRDGLRVGRAADCAQSDQNDRMAALFAAHNQALLRFLNCRLKSMQEAMEVAQEAYVRMLQLDTSDGIGYLRAYLFKIAANLAADRLKSVARRERIDKLEILRRRSPTRTFPGNPNCGATGDRCDPEIT